MSASTATGGALRCVTLSRMAAMLAPSSLSATFCSKLVFSSTACSPLRSRPGAFQRQPLRRSAIMNTVSGVRSAGLSSMQWLSSSLPQSESTQLHGGKIRSLATAAGETSADSPSAGETQAPAPAAVKCAHCPYCTRMLDRQRLPAGEGVDNVRCELHPESRQGLD